MAFVLCGSLKTSKILDLYTSKDVIAYDLVLCGPIKDKCALDLFSLLKILSTFLEVK